MLAKFKLCNLSKALFFPDDTTRPLLSRAFGFPLSPGGDVPIFSLVFHRSVMTEDQSGALFLKWCSPSLRILQPPPTHGISL